ncbi:MULTISPECIES: hypothetical protein [unclassified Nocardia]|uniref:hypothetical protein n=1 Tax=unclassified Nocardia TaxID=2637762 RepID=UPI001CE48227|nr:MULTISPECIES: hypothetical protein [unclassified Nocardia]
MAPINQPTNLLDEIAALRREVAELRKRSDAGAVAVAVQFVRTRQQDAPVVTSAAFETVWVADLVVTHTGLEITTSDGCDPGTTGEGQIVLESSGSSTVVADWLCKPGPNVVRRGPFPLTGARSRVSLRYRRTGGAGSVYAAVLGAVQYQI